MEGGQLHRLSLDHQKGWRDADGKLTRANVSGITNVYYEFLQGASSVSVSGTNHAMGNDRLAVGFGFGGTYNWDNDKYSVCSEALIKVGFNDNAGGAAGFRVKW